MAIPAEIPTRALREIYLRPFELVIRAPNPPNVLMTAYNRINGIHVSEDPFLLTHVLRNEWNWKGMVVSDWFGTCSADASTLAGLDVEMPGWSIVRGPALLRALRTNKLSPNDLYKRVRNVRELELRHLTLHILKGILYAASQPCQHSSAKRCS
jgi:beta-glucosidase